MENLGLILWLSFSLICSIWCYKLAKKSNQNTVIAAVIGFLVPVGSVLIYLYISSNKTPAQKVKMKKESYIVLGVLFIIGGLANLLDLNKMTNQGDVIWYIACLLIGFYFLYSGIKIKLSN